MLLNADVQYCEKSTITTAKTNTRRHNLKAGTAAENASGKKKKWLLKLLKLKWDEQGNLQEGLHPLLASRPFGKTRVGTC